MLNSIPTFPVLHSESGGSIEVSIEEEAYIHTHIRTHAHTHAHTEYSSLGRETELFVLYGWGRKEDAERTCLVLRP